MDIDAGVNKDRPLRAFVLEIPNRRRTAKAIDHHDLALNIHIGRRREIEEVDAASRGKTVDADGLPADAAGRRADRKAGRLGAIGFGARDQRRADRHAQEQLRHVHGVGDAQRRQAIRDVVESGTLVLGGRFSHQGGVAFDQ